MLEKREWYRSGQADLSSQIRPTTLNVIEETAIQYKHYYIVFCVMLICLLSIYIVHKPWHMNSVEKWFANIWIKVASLPSKIRSQFNLEWVWRMYIVIQIIGLSGILYLVYANYTGYWRFLRRYKFSFNEIDEILLFLVLPFAISKSIDWIISGTSNKKN